MSAHGDSEPVDAAVWLGPDPALALVTADLDAWLNAHPCECEALCDCEHRRELHRLTAP